MEIPGFIIDVIVQFEGPKVSKMAILREKWEAGKWLMAPTLIYSCSALDCTLQQFFFKINKKARRSYAELCVIHSLA